MTSNKKQNELYDLRRSTLNPLNVVNPALVDNIAININNNNNNKTPKSLQISRDDSNDDVEKRVKDMKKQKISNKEKRQKYKRGSIVDRYRRASVFDEIVSQIETDDNSKQQKDGENNNGNSSHRNQHQGQHQRIKHIQETKALGLSQSHRARMIAFEMAANQVKEHEKRKKQKERDEYNMSDDSDDENSNGDDGDDDAWYLNPYSVASMPEDIRKGFILKVFGILWIQIVVMIITIAVVKFTTIAELIYTNYWAYLCVFIAPYVFLGLLFGVREKHPINLIVFSLFTISLSTMIGLIYYYLTDNLFMVTMVGMVLMVGVIMWYCKRSLEEFTFWKTFGVIMGCSFVTSIVSGIFFQAKYWHSHIWPGFATMIFGTWLMWDIIAIQIDLTPDEYIIGALDLYLDIVNLILWLLIGCLYCMEVVLKFAH